MGVMTVETPLVLEQRFMPKPDSFGFIADLFMTFNTELIPSFCENKFVIRGMGIVACYTLAFGYHLMGTERLFR